LRLEIQYTSSEIGEFLSMFSEQPEAKEEFNVDTFYQQSKRIYTILEPLLAGLIAIVALLRAPKFSRAKFIARVSLIAVAFYPWIFTILLELYLLRYIVWQFVYRAWARKRLQMDDRVAGVGAKRNQEDELNGEVNAMAVGAVTLAGPTERLPLTQKAVRHVADTLDNFKGCFEWRYPRTTFFIFVLLLVALIYSIFGCQSNVWAAVCILFVCWNTATIQGFSWISTGFRRFREKRQRRTTQIGGINLEQKKAD